MAVGQCPSCSAPVDFRPGAGKVKICEHCNTVVLRGEFKLENLGKVAELLDTESPLKVGLSGAYSGSAFSVVGRIQKANAGGTWDEWCLSFDDGRAAWLSESEGDWNLMFPLDGVVLPDPNALRPLLLFPIRDKTFCVEEVDRASTLAAEGQLPEFNREHLYADCTGPRGVFASLDYGQNAPGEAYVGNKVSLAQLGFDKGALEPQPRHEALKGARCTNCNGMLELKAPDATKRVACPYCGALLDVAHGKLNFLQLLEKPPYEPVLPLGAQGTLEGTPCTVLAFLIRSCTVEGTRYPWEEYLLWNREKGFAWLIHSTGHWSLLTPIPAGEVQLQARAAQYLNVSYRAYQSVFATTEYVAGECYWTVTVGELAKATEFVAPPYSVNLDETQKEVTFTFGKMLEPGAVQAAFRLKAKLPPPQGIASALVNPFREKASSAWKWSALWCIGLIALTVVFAAMGNTATYYSGDFSVPAGAASGSPESQAFSEPFEISADVPLEVSMSAPGLSNNWLGVSVDLVNEKTGEVIAVYGEAEHYSGVTDGESWSEGSRTISKQTDKVDRGFYVLRATPQYDANKATNFGLTVRADDTPGFCCPFLLFFMLLVGPLYYQLRASSFETQRWADSVFQMAPGADSFPNRKDDDDD